MNKPKHKYPHAHAHEQARLNAIKTLGLHEHNTAEDRARALGFDLNENLYHGTNSDFPAFEKHPRYGAGTYATEDPEIADIYAESERREGNAHPNVLPIVARGKKLTVSDLHPEDPHTGGWFRDNMAKATGIPKIRRMEEQLPKHGYDRLQINDMSDLGGLQTQHMFPDPSVIRSRFAAFDPHRVHENDLLAAKGGNIQHKDLGGAIKGLATANNLSRLSDVPYIFDAVNSAKTGNYGDLIGSAVNAALPIGPALATYSADLNKNEDSDLNKHQYVQGHFGRQERTWANGLAKGGKVTHAHHLEIEERPL